MSLPTVPEFDFADVATEQIHKQSISAAVASASAERVEGAASRLAPYLEKGRWLGANNRYSVKTDTKFKADVKLGSFEAKHLEEYTAASASLHCADGWSYLGRALQAQFCGDVRTARHLGYYAELRAAMGILATRGITILNTKHASLGDGGTNSYFDQRTHPAAWKALETWSDGADAANALSDVVRPMGVEIGEWVGAFPGRGYWGSIGRSWLRSWGLDLYRFERDLVSRNEMSYRPSGVRSAPEFAPDELVRFGQDFWAHFEPSAGAPFAECDLALLRASVVAIFRVGNRSRSLLDGQFRSDVERMQNDILGTTNESLTEYLLTHDSSVSSSLPAHAKSRVGPHHKAHHFAVISRAALLLRVASGMASNLLENSELSDGMLDAWRSGFGKAHAICEDELPAEIFDLVADVEDASTSISSLLIDKPGLSLQSIVASEGSSLALMAGTERIAIWGIKA
jgi:hypothetical protein